jgi:hypothetical protein
MAATIKACPQCLMPSVAETAGACNTARPQCLVPLLAKTAGACCQTQLARYVSCPCWPRPLGLAVKRSSPMMSWALVGRDRWGLLYIISLLAMSTPLWRDRHSTCCKKNGSLPAVLCRLAVTIAACFFIVVLIVVQPLRTFHTTPTINLACPRCLVPLLAKTTGAWGQTFVACPRCLAPLLAKTAGLAVYRSCLPAMSSALIGQDRWGLLSKKLARPQYQCPRGATAIWLPVENLVACP